MNAKLIKELRDISGAGEPGGCIRHTRKRVKYTTEQ